MAIKGYNESTLSGSEVFQRLNEAINDPDQTMQKKAVRLIQSTKPLTMEDIETAYISVRQITDTLTRLSMKAFDTGKVVLIYNRTPSLSVSQTLPFLTLRRGSDYFTYVFMDKYIKISRDDVMTLSAPILRDLLTGATISNGLKYHYDIMASNEYLQTTLTSIYTKMVIRVLNRLYSVITDKVLFDKMQYFINKFFLMQVMCANNTPENIDRIASAHFKFVDELDVEECKKQYADANPLKLSQLLELLKTLSPRMSALHLGSFIGAWTEYYYIATTLAVDNIEYFIFAIITLLSGNNMITSIAASDIVKETKNIKSLRSELLKIVQ